MFCDVNCSLISFGLVCIGRCLSSESTWTSASAGVSSICLVVPTVLRVNWRIAAVSDVSSGAAATVSLSSSL